MRNAGNKFLVLTLVVGGAALAAAGFILFDAFVLEPNSVTVSRVRLKQPSLKRALRGVAIAQISDLHLKEKLGFRERTLIRKINRLRPHLILITGDLVEDEKAAPLAAEFLRCLKPRLWSYGILGNSDIFYLHSRDFSPAWRKAGLSLIGGRSLKMEPGDKGFPFWLAGIDYGAGDIESRVENIMKDIPRSAPVIFLSYSPDLAPYLIERGADLVLSGDTHGGQVTFPGWSKIFPLFGRSRFVRGLYSIGAGYLYVNRGVGTKIFPVRFLCPPEITLFQFD